MRLQKTTRYALYAATEMAQAELEGTVTASGVAELYGVPVSVMAKAFQQLVRANLAVGMRGQHGGYRLARPASEITLLEVIEAFEHLTPSAQTSERVATTEGGSPARGASRRLQRVFDEVDELVRCTYASISLETVVRDSIGEDRASQRA